MHLLRTVALCIALQVARGDDSNSFPPDFKFGVASASYQVEGGWNADDKSESIWDRFLHEHPEVISDRSNGDVACDSYHLWRRDVQMIKEVGAHFYRFSISWPRLLPTGFANKVSEAGSAYYSELIDELLREGIEPVVTLYHWDLPQTLQDLGGWTNPLIAEWFADYARVAYSLYGDRVKTWITINEPVVVCDAVYNYGVMAPGIYDPEVAPYICNKNLLIAHAKAFRVYDEEFRALYNGKISLSNNFIWYEALTPEDEEIAELSRQYLGRYSYAIFSKEGGWHPDIEKILEENSIRKGYRRSNLPKFTEEEKEYVKGTYDFFGINLYTSRLVRLAQNADELGPFLVDSIPDLNATFSVDPSWKTTHSSWFYVNPKSIRNQLVWLKKQYGDLEFLITENGYASGRGLEDTERVEYYHDYLEQILLAIKEDGVNVVGYTAWTLMDNFEWNDGYQSNFGLYEVDFTSPERTRTPRASAKYYAKVIKDYKV